jgi:hypothetical protein
MKTIYIYLILAIAIYQKSNDSKYWFIGYVGDQPVFQNSATGNLKIMTNDFTFVDYGNSKTNIDIIVDSMLVFKTFNNQDWHLTIQKSSITNSVNLGSEDGVYFIGNKDTVFFASYSDNLKIWVMTIDSLYYSGVSGFPIHFDNGIIYYSKIEDSKAIHPNVNIYKIALNDKSKKPKVIARNVSGESSIIMQSGKFFYDKILHDNEFRHAIVNCSTGTISFFEVPKEFDLYSPVYSRKHNCLLFINTEKWTIFKKELQ